VIVKFHNRGAGAGSGPVEYLLGRGYDDPTQPNRPDSSLLAGNPKQIVDVIDSLRFATKYTSGVLSFTESDLSEGKKAAIMDLWEKTLFPGMEKDEYQCLWVQHKDKGRLELNFVIPKVHLPTGRQLTPYYIGQDLKLVKSFKDIVNYQFDLSDPNDPRRKRTQQRTRDEQSMPTAVMKTKEAIHKEVTALIGVGAIENRDDVIAFLGGAGLELARENESSISVKNPNAKRNIRLKGIYYERDFRAGDHTETALREATEGYVRDREARHSSAQKDYRSCLQGRRERFEERYQSSLRPWETEYPAAATYDINSDRNIISANDLGADELVQSSDSRLQQPSDEQRANETLLREEITTYDQIRRNIETSTRAATAAIRAAVQRIVTRNSRTIEIDSHRPQQLDATREQRTHLRDMQEPSLER
tara:strand:- start:157 stop:1413 length:1257 start_codon:yes stop_codon:yes gene_type:complete